MSLPQQLLDQLRKIDQSTEFTGRVGGKVRSSNGNLYFAKIGSPEEQEQYVGEAESLNGIGIGAPGLAPRILSSGVLENGKPFFISEYKDMGMLSDKAATVLGKRLATELHRYKSQHGFGFHVPTYCGATRMENGWYESWEKCYDAMIEDLISKLKKKGRYDELCRKGETVRERVIPKLLGPLVIEPVLLHGDLWSGNTGIDRATGEPVIFDPSSFFGHNEADLAIARIFGGIIPRAFFTEYHSHLPRTEPTDQYELRGHLYELFHYLNHTVLFGGGGYESSAMGKMDILLKANL